MKAKDYLNSETVLFNFIRISIFSLIVLVIIAAYLLRMEQISKRFSESAAKLRYKSFLLADQLRQSSDDLTRMVRTYVATGNKKFEEYFWTILDIRDGKKARPEHYERVYWDFMTVENPVPPFKNGSRVSLQKLMRKAGFTDQEFQLLAAAKKRSDELIALEKIAMHAIKGEFQDERGGFSIHSEPDSDMAMRIVFGEEYHQAKLKIMEPINKFLSAIDQRTWQSLERANREERFYSRSIVYIFIALIINGLLLFIASKRHQRIQFRSIKESENKLKQAQKIAKLGHWEHEFKTNKLVWSDEIYRIFEINPATSAPSYESFLDAVHPDDKKLVDNTYMESVRKRIPYSVDHRLLFKDGHIKFVREQGKTFYDVNGDPIRSLGIVQDLTSQKQMENELNKTQMHYTSFINSSSDPVSYLKVPPGLKTSLPVRTQMEMLYNSVFVDANKANWRSFGLNSKDELIGKSYTELVGEKTYDTVLSDFINNNYQLTDYEVCQDAQNGEKYFGLENWFGVIENGTLTYIWKISKDITERKAAEQEKARLESQLRRVQKMEAIGTLTGGIAHDFNNILTPIIGFTDLLYEDAPDGSPIKEKVERISEAGKRAADLVRQLLTLSRETEQDLKPLEIGHIVKEVIKLIRSSLPTSIEIRSNLDKQCGLIMADPTQLHQIILNLITNAFHAMEDKGGVLEINLDEVELSDDDLKSKNINSGKYVCLRISDTGNGIRREHIERIFDPYFTTKEQGKGTGLGLSIVHSLVKSYSGDIRVYSEVDAGTVFKVFLPVIESSDLPEVLPEPIENLKGNERLLVIDDEPDILEMEEEMLDRLGYKVTVSNRSIEALNLFRQDPYRFDVIISDMTMPEMTGDILASRLMEIRPDIPIIICSGFSQKISVERAKKAGLRGFIMKPIIKRDVAMAIRKAINN